MESSPPSSNTRSNAKECKKCDYCLIKKELSKLNQSIICPSKANSKRLFDTDQADKKKLIKLTTEETEKETEQLATSVVESVLG
jgi:hypothetical protein